MDSTELEKLESLVKIALTNVDIYEHPIKLKDIQTVREYFTKERGFVVSIIGSPAVDNEQVDTNIKYRPLFQRPMGVI